MRSSPFPLLVGLFLAPGLCLPLPSGQQQTGSYHYGLTFNIHLPSAQLASKGKAVLGCLVKGSNNERFFAKWFRDGKPVGASGNSTVKPMQVLQGEYSSNLTISGQEWSSADMYSCVVGQNVQLFQAMQKSTDKNTVESSAPSGHLHPLHHEEIILPESFLTFGCMFKMKIPKVVSIRWHKNRHILPEDAGSQTLKEESDGSYSLSDEMNIRQLNWHTRDTFSCTYVNKGHA